MVGGGAAPRARNAGFFGVPIATARMDEALDWVVSRVREKAPALLVAFVSPDRLNIAYRPAEYHKILTHAARVLPDGIGIKSVRFYSGRIPRVPWWMRETGTEWLFRLMRKPGRLWRRCVIGNPLFLYRVWRQRMNRTPHATARPD